MLTVARDAPNGALELIRNSRRHKKEIQMSHTCKGVLDAVPPEAGFAALIARDAVRDAQLTVWLQAPAAMVTSR